MYRWARFSDWIIRHPRPIVAVCVVATLFLGYWSTRVKTDHRPGHFLADDSDVVRNYRHLTDAFAQTQALFYIVVPDGDVRDDAFLAKLDSVTSAIESMHGVESVLSLTNVPFLVREGDSLVAHRLYDPTLPHEVIESRIEDQVFLKGLLLSDDGTDPAIIVTLNDDFNNTSARVTLVKKVQRMARSTLGPVALAGLPYLRSMYATRVTREAPLFTCLALLISLLMLYVTFRARRAVILPTIVVALGIIWTVGLIALFDHRLNIVTSVLPALLVIIGMANSIHLTTKFYDRYQACGNRRQAIDETMHIVGQATFLTSLTTAVGFFVLVLSGSDLLSGFGIFASIGIAILYILSVTLIPLACVWLKPPSQERLRLATHAALTDFFDRVGRFARDRSTAILTVSLGMLAIGVFGATRISSDIFVFSDFYEDDPLRQDLKVFENAYGGILPLEVVIESRNPGRFRSLSNLRRVEQLQEKVEPLEGVGHSFSAADYLKLANQAYFGGRPAAFRLPSNYEMPFLQNALSGFVEESPESLTRNLPRFVDSTFTITRVYLGVHDLGTTNMNVLADEVLDETRALFPEANYTTFVTGTAIKSTASGENLVTNLAISLAVALVVISIIMAMLFRSTRLTLISLAPNVIPLVLVGGAMGFAGIVLKPSTALIFPLAFGIAVDDTIHFLAKYRMVRANGVARDPAVIQTLRETGKAILFTSLVLMGGFLVFTLSSFGGTVSLGALTALTLAGALVANLFLLPALIHRYGPLNESDRKEQN
ncbi:MAG: MMPL family transporter [Rhodothermales bacterium]